MDKTQLIIAALQQRIGELVGAYETQIAMLRAELTELVNNQNQKIEQEYEKKDAIEDYSESIIEKIKEA